MKALLLILVIALGITPLTLMGSTTSSSHYGVYNDMTIYNITGFPNGVDPAYYSEEPFFIKSNVTPIIVNVAQNMVFNNTGIIPKVVTLYIPPGNYSMILLNISIKEYGGAQFDRPVYIFANGIPIFWGSTQEIRNSTAQTDVTMFENLLQGNVTFQLVLATYYAKSVGIVGLYSMNVTLLLYPGNKPAGLPNYFIPLFMNSLNYSRVVLNPLNDQVTQSVVMPNGTFRSVLLLYYEGGGLDEFWYTNIPATRNILVYYNSLLAGVVNPYPIIYTGGINLFWWRPVTSINTLAFETPQYIELTPLLATSTKPNITVTVSNLLASAQELGSTALSWTISGVLMLWVNNSNPLISSKLISADARYVDSQPIFTGLSGSTYYQQGEYYSINYTSILKFENGQEFATTYEEGKVTAYQSFNPSFIYQQAILDQQFKEISLIKGLHNAELILEGTFPINLQLTSFVVPITNPNIIPYNASYLQNGTLSLGLFYKFGYVYDNYNLTIQISENSNAIGGFSGILEIINKYGGAVLVSITSNYAQTQKSLNAIYLVNGKGFEENFYALGVQNSTNNTAGYLVKYEINYEYI
ncbi:peptide-N4-asparagine amidase [Sulfolobus acidocaldarius]|uniref:Conserved Archaeal protein n=4 Tax=Sulfolobus acidocaldarius TaxID=2285 RepID=Q4J9N3_SULAC|nr:peptide-N4-asparagine amidase [Sulfolobus acidocaldarius]AAY80497.1 conserved Archaeal protein [Sulfolobus acidocaldarius DSM 639]AGE71083.1 hypothetical protein SacN8_05590 [Sulfolobus acidocaldarius N8]AGE73354.1 hypothetical protein SacRon12I_05580 [Sulfolobus acidocaldarius Ron12/I]ALU28637.1 glycopeptidase [Sulfolobus acidocaldarius]ALU31353.1 glycopeptidase [Sulfolobus acidocaldarius]